MISFTIMGEMASKANSRRLVMFKGRPAFIKSDKALAYEKAAQAQIPASARCMYAVPVRVTVRAFYKSERPDLDASLLLDCLQAKFAVIGGCRVCVRKGVYENDRLVRALLLLHGIDKANPRAEVIVEPMTAQQEPLEFPKDIPT